MRLPCGAVAICAALLMSGCDAGVPAVPDASRPADGVRGDIDTFRIVMPQLGGRERTIRVYVPPGYHDTARRYPVLYLQDGQSAFVPGAYGDWLVDETIDRLVRDGSTGGLIVVAIDHSEHRWNEYGPWLNRTMHRWVSPSWSEPTQGGEGAAYVDFLTTTLKPEIDRRYRSLPGREHTGVGGASMGGIISLYAVLTRGDVFSMAMAMSPAVWFAEGGEAWLSSNYLLEQLEASRPPPEARYYIDIGTEERSRESDPDVRDTDGAPVSYPRAYIEGARALADALEANGVPATNVRLVVDSGAAHHESAWARRLAGAVLWLFAGRED